MQSKRGCHGIDGYVYAECNEPVFGLATVMESLNTIADSIVNGANKIFTYPVKIGTRELALA